MDRTEPKIKQLLQEIDSKIRQIETEPDSGVSMFNTVNYGMIHPKMIRSGELKNNVCCILGASTGEIDDSVNGNIDAIQYEIPIIGFFYLPTMSDYSGMTTVLEPQYHFIQQVFDMTQDNICEWDFDIVVVPSKFEVNAQVGNYNAWYYDTVIVPPYYVSIIILKIKTIGSDL